MRMNFVGIKDQSAAEIGPAKKGTVTQRADGPTLMIMVKPWGKSVATSLTPVCKGSSDRSMIAVT